MKHEIASKYFKHPEKYIPHGPYCYTPIKLNNLGMSISICPFWDKDSSKEKQNCGYCHFLGYGDWEVESLSLLWDQVKECQLNL